jgi:hypothetical protein
MRAQAAVTAAEPIMLALCWRFTALCMAMPRASAKTASSIAKAWAGAVALARVTTFATESTIWLFTVPSLISLLLLSL